MLIPISDMLREIMRSQYTRDGVRPDRIIASERQIKLWAREANMARDLLPDDPRRPRLNSLMGVEILTLETEDPLICWAVKPREVA